MASPPNHRVEPGSKFRLVDIDPASTPAFPAKKGEKNGDLKARAESELEEHAAAIAKFQERLWAENQRALLVVLQGMDTSGKDGVIRHVFHGVNPQGCHVTSFKKPSEAEADRDYLWRIHAAVPPKGEIGIFNRAHYEDVLIVRVHSFVPEKIWRDRYEQINEFEKYLASNHITILKFMLHISKDEQRERLQARLDDPEKHWKFSPQDVEERKLWPSYMDAYQDAVAKCSTAHAPWHVIPADRKWYARWAIAGIVRATLEEMAPKPPKVDLDVSKIVIK
ncbi:MAG TPA: polyphosphate kinase 2 family protein [Phycisphaerales bacterium]|nr:polyphosphate kinase 2 family protein [Phycisphaerales bacterium]